MSGQHILFAIHSVISISLPFIVLFAPDWMIPYIFLIFILIWVQWQICGGCVLTQWEHQIEGKEITLDNSWRGNFFHKKIRLLFNMDLSESDICAMGNSYHAVIMTIVVLRLLCNYFS